MKLFNLSLLVFSFPFLISCHHTSQNKSDNLSKGKDSVVNKADSTDIKINFYTGKITTNPKDADAYWNRGKWEATKIQNPASLSLALADLLRAVQLDSAKSGYYYTLANVDFMTGKTHEARDAFQTSIRLNPKNTDAILKLAELYLYVKKYKESIDLIESAININPHIAKEYFMKGIIFLENKDSTKAISSFQTAVEQDPDYFDAYIQLGLIFSHRGNPVALTYFSNAATIQPENPEPYYDKGLFYQFSADDYRSAIIAYRQLIEVDSINSASNIPHSTFYKSAWYNLGVIYYINKERYDTALTYFSKAISADSTYYLAYYGRGNCYENLKNKEKALSDFATAYRINSSFKDALEAYNELKKKK